METLALRQILCPTDFDDLATLALEHAVRLAQLSGAQITVLYADRFLPPLEFTAGETDQVARSLDAEKAEALRQLWRYVRDHVPSGIAAEAVVVATDPVDAILLEAEKRHADLIAMGTHARTGLDRLMLGSVTERILLVGRVPVLAVRQSPAGAAPGAEIRRILLPTNFTPADEIALAQAIGLAALLSAELVVAYVTSDLAAEKPFRDRLCAWMPEAVQSHCSLRPVVRHGDPAEQIITLAAEEGVDLVVVVAQRRRLFDLEVFGTTTERIVRHAPAPVWVVPHG